MNIVERIVHWFGLRGPATRDDEINAEIDNKLRDFNDATEKLKETLSKRSKGNDALRSSLRTAVKRTNSFAEFEREIQRGRHVRRSD